MKRIISAISDQINNDFEKSLQMSKAEGYEYVDLCTYNGKCVEILNKKEIEEIKALLKKYDMKICSIASSLFMNCKLHEDYEIQTINPLWTFEGDFDAHINKFAEIADVAKELNAMNIRIFPFRWPSNKGIVGEDDDLELISSIFKKVAKIAEEKDVLVAIENCPYSHCPKGEMTFKLCEMIGSDHVKMLWDPANSYRAYTEHVPPKYLGKDQKEELELVYRNIGHIHFKDYHYVDGLAKPFTHVPLGDGDIPFEYLFKRLDELGYKGAISCEPEVPNEADIIKCLKFMYAINK